MFHKIWYAGLMKDMLIFYAMDRAPLNDLTHVYLLNI
jgi:hypothetical protein